MTTQTTATGLKCDECGKPVQAPVVPLGGCICDACWDAILGAELVDLVFEPDPVSPARAELRQALGLDAATCNVPPGWESV